MDSKEDMSAHYPTSRPSSLGRHLLTPPQSNDDQEPGLFCEKSATLPSAIKRTSGQSSELAKRRRRNEDAATKNGAKAKTKPPRPQVKRKGPDRIKALPMSECTEGTEAEKEAHVQNICGLLKNFHIGRDSIPYIFPEAIRPRPETDNGYKQKFGHLMSSANPPVPKYITFKSVEEYSKDFLAALWLFLAVSIRQSRGVFDKEIPDIPTMLSNIVAERQRKAAYGSSWDWSAEVLAVDLERAVLLQVKSLKAKISQPSLCFEGTEGSVDLGFPLLTLQPEYLLGYENNPVTTKRLVEDIRKSRDFVASRERDLIVRRNSFNVTRHRLFDLRKEYIGSRRTLLGFLEMLQRRIEKTPTRHRGTKVRPEAKSKAVAMATPATQLSRPRKEDRKVVDGNVDGSTRSAQCARPQDHVSKAPRPSQRPLSFVEGLLRDIENG
ncbi:hypothetical protein K490DRAFT_60820 [Saccharata proteae CBS 121410]|uniref:Uncharacterized protein n=1 Tax=Saccharata proteae CBS 121410 TaxID=1314787 RepID=A0A9P4LY97_9PEZI|nr:hypothetical protein K490DRAFT_60820 [Saccharata proteae CBS 121410]